MTSLPASLDLSVRKSSLPSPVQSSSSPLVVSLPFSSYTDSIHKASCNCSTGWWRLHCHLTGQMSKSVCTQLTTSHFTSCWSVLLVQLVSLPPASTTVFHVLQLLSLLDSAKACPRNPEKKFLENLHHLTRQPTLTGLFWKKPYGPTLANYWCHPLQLRWSAPAVRGAVQIYCACWHGNQVRTHRHQVTRTTGTSAVHN